MTAFNLWLQPDPTLNGLSHLGRGNGSLLIAADVQGIG